MIWKDNSHHGLKLLYYLEAVYKIYKLFSIVCLNSDINLLFFKSGIQESDYSLRNIFYVSLLHNKIFLYNLTE